MRRLIRIAVVGAMLMGQSIAQSAAGNPAAEVEKFFHAFVGLNDDQIRDIRAGRALASTAGLTLGKRGKTRAGESP